ncbi:MAG: hypothetical protein RL685_2036 [Pseudomonadota bacterium]|jgi:hypothetical protein
MQLFRRSLNYLPLGLAACVGGLGACVTAGVGYYFSPDNLQVGYAPEQPIPYSHKLHVDELGLDCRYCHSNVERSQEAMIPPTQACMGCHAVVKPDSPQLAALRDSWKSGNPIPWIRVHELPDHAYFDHSAHLPAGVGCVSCHGRVDQMEVVRLDAPLAMGQCLECHRNPAPQLRPKSELTNMSWQRDDTSPVLAATSVHPPEHCTGCHR